jgi:hypothetical protein
VSRPGLAANVHPSSAVSEPNRLVTPSKQSIRITSALYFHPEKRTNAPRRKDKHIAASSSP